MSESGTINAFHYYTAAGLSESHAGVDKWIGKLQDKYSYCLQGSANMFMTTLNTLSVLSAHYLSEDMWVGADASNSYIEVGVFHGNSFSFFSCIGPRLTCSPCGPSLQTDSTTAQGTKCVAGYCRLTEPIYLMYRHLVRGPVSFFPEFWASVTAVQSCKDLKRNGAVQNGIYAVNIQGYPFQVWKTAEETDFGGIVLNYCLLLLLHTGLL